jgi:tetratricopeptide (TPR) repeat protein
MHSRISLRHCLALFLSSILICSTTLATAGTEEAREYYKEAVKLYNAGKFEESARLLKKAYEEEANLTYQYNRIRALQGAGKYEEALEVLKAYEKPMLDAKGFDDIEQIKADLKEQVAAQKSEAETDVQAKDSDAEKREARETFTPAQKPQARQTDETGTDAGSKRSPTEIAGWASVGAGAASIGAGTLLASGLLLGFDPQAEDTTPDTDQLTLPQDKYDKLQRQKVASFVTFGVGAAAAITGGVLLLTGGQEAPPAEQGQASADSTKGPEVRLTPLFSSSGGGAQLGIEF